MQDENSQDLRSQLYERFREALGKPVGERFFEEDELIDIFDYAGDLNDDYVRAEVLFCGARLYPDSDALLVRRSILYADTLDADSFRGFVTDNADKGESIIWKIEKLYSDPPAPDKAPGVLSDLLGSKESFEDEEMIRLVKLARDLSQLDWLKDNSARLRACTGYLPVLLYEAGIQLYEAGEYSEARPYFEELTRLEPFEATYWAILFNVSGILQLSAEAREAFDFACGLEITDPETAAMLGQGVTGEFADLRPAAIEKLESALTLSPDYFRLIQVLANLYRDEGRMDEASRLLRGYCARYPSRREGVDLAIYLGLDCDMDLFSEYLHAGGGQGYTREDVASILTVLMMGKRWKDVRLVGATYSFFSEERVDELQMIYTEACFHLGEYEECLEFYYKLSAPEGILTIAPAGPTLLSLHYRSLLALGRREVAAKLAESLRLAAGIFMDMMDMPGRLMVRGLLSTLDSAGHD